MTQTLEEMFPLKEKYVFHIRHFDRKISNVIKTLPCVRKT